MASSATFITILVLCTLCATTVARPQPEPRAEPNWLTRAGWGEYVSASSHSISLLSINPTATGGGDKVTRRVTFHARTFQQVIMGYPNFLTFPRLVFRSFSRKKNLPRGGRRRRRDAGEKLKFRIH